MKKVILTIIVVVLGFGCFFKKDDDDSPKPEDTVEKITIPEGKLRIHYHRKDGDYDNWGLHLWGDAIDYEVKWDEPIFFDKKDDFGVYTDIDIDNRDETLNFIVHHGNYKNR